MKLGCRHNYYKGQAGQAALRIYANQLVPYDDIGIPISYLLTMGQWPFSIVSYFIVTNNQSFAALILICTLSPFELVAPPPPAAPQRIIPGDLDGGALLLVEAPGELVPPPAPGVRVAALAGLLEGGGQRDVVVYELPHLDKVHRDALHILPVLLIQYAGTEKNALYCICLRSRPADPNVVCSFLLLTY